MDMFNGFVWQTRTLEVRLDRIPPELDFVNGGAAAAQANQGGALGRSASGMGGISGQGHVPPQFIGGGLGVNGVGAGGFHVPSPLSALPLLAAQQQQFGQIPDVSGLSRDDAVNLAILRGASTGLGAGYGAGLGLDRPRSTSSGGVNMLGAKTLYVGNVSCTLHCGSPFRANYCYSVVKATVSLPVAGLEGSFQTSWHRSPSRYFIRSRRPVTRLWNCLFHQ